MKKICLWSCPRNVSTALMYSFRSRPDTIVFDEPLYAHYLNVSDANHPGKQEVLESQESNGNKVVKDVILQEYTNHSFFKLMTHFLVDIDKSFLKKVINIIFIRDPKEIIYSYSKVIKSPGLSDIGIKKQVELYNYLKESNITPIVLDSKYLLMNPELILRKLSNLLEIPYLDQMLGWESGPKKEDGIWAKYWYNNVHKSTSFLPYNINNIELGKELSILNDECLPFYNFLTEKSIKI